MSSKEDGRDFTLLVEVKGDDKSDSSGVSKSKKVRVSLDGVKNKVDLHQRLAKELNRPRVSTVEFFDPTFEEYVLSLDAFLKRPCTMISNPPPTYQHLSTHFSKQTDGHLRLNLRIFRKSVR